MCSSFRLMNTRWKGELTMHWILLNITSTQPRQFPCNICVWQGETLENELMQPLDNLVCGCRNTEYGRRWQEARTWAVDSYQKKEREAQESPLRWLRFFSMNSVIQCGLCPLHVFLILCGVKTRQRHLAFDLETLCILELMAPYSCKL